EASDQPTCSKSLPTRIQEDGSGDIIGRLQSISQKLFFSKNRATMLDDLMLLKKDVQMVVPTFKLEPHWSNIVHNSDKLSTQAYDQQEAVWEFITTEHQYLQANEIFLLKQMNEFHQYFLKLQEAGYMRYIDSRRIFLNYSELYAHHSKFWENEVLQMLQISRKNGILLDLAVLKSGFERLDEWLPSYKIFLCSYDDCYNYIKNCQEENILFREFVTWAETQDVMKRQRLLDVLAYPMQRLTRYSLLLKAVLKYTVDDIKRDIIQGMITRTEEAARDVDETLKNNDLQNELKQLPKVLSLCKIMKR
ncbi:unnamed protein product, partial [Onchocerca ochengi]